MADIIGITGSIATGKSLVAQYLIQKGFQVFSADEIAHDIGNSPKVLSRISKAFGSEMIINQKLNRKKLGKLVFQNEDKLVALNEIMGPEIRKEITQSIEKVHESKEKKPAFIEIPLLFEQNYDNYLDATIFVYVTENIQLRRLMRRDNIDLSFAKEKISKQMSVEQKKHRANYLIDNSRDMHTTYHQINELLKKLLK